MTQEDARGLTSVVAGYGTSTKPKDVAAFYAAAVRWLGLVGHPPDFAAVNGAGFSGKPVKFATADKQLRRVGFAKVSTLEVSAMLPDWNTFAEHWLCSVSWSGEEGGVAIVASLSAVVPFGGEHYTAAADLLVATLKPRYGIGYRMEETAAASMYVSGIGFSRGAGGLVGEAYERTRRMAKWGNTAMEEEVWEEGTLRDVYEWNYLTAPALGRDVGGYPLSKWIAQDAARGALQIVGAGAVWRVDPDHIPAVREQLEAAGLLFR